MREVLERHRWPLVRAGAVALLTRPAIALHFVRTRARPYARRLLVGRWSTRSSRAAAAAARGAERAASSEGAPAPVAVVAAVVVDPAARRGGVGEALLAAFCERARGAGTPAAELVTRAQGGAARFYERLGWHRVADRTSRDGARVLTYRLDLDGTDGARARTASDRGSTSARTGDDAGPGGAPAPSPARSMARTSAARTSAARPRGGTGRRRPDDCSARSGAA